MNKYELDECICYICYCVAINQLSSAYGEDIDCRINYERNSPEFNEILNELDSRKDIHLFHAPQLPTESYEEYRKFHRIWVNYLGEKPSKELWGDFLKARFSRMKTNYLIALNEIKETYDSNLICNSSNYNTHAKQFSLLANLKEKDAANSLFWINQNYDCTEENIDGKTDECFNYLIDIINKMHINLEENQE